MLKFVLWSAAISTVGATALFMPLDPALLAAVGLGQTDTNVRVAPLALPAGQAPLKIISSSPGSGQKAEITVVRAPATSPYQAAKRAAAKPLPERSRSAAFAAPARLPVPPAPSAATAPARVSDAVVRELQRELRRVQCYQGRIDGDWGPASRFAMAAFTTSVNAALPTDRPDIVLLTLVRRHAGTACGHNRAAPVQSAKLLVPKARVKTTQAWRTRVVPAPPRLAQRPRPQAPRMGLVEAPRIVRDRGRPSRAVSVASRPAGGTGAAVATPASAYRPFNTDARMALGVVPRPRAARPVTSSPSSTFATQRAQRSAVKRLRYKRKRSVKRRRYRRRSRSKSWRHKVFPNIYN